MSPRTTGILALLALLLGAFVYFYEIEGEPARQAAQEDEKRIHPGLADADIEAIELTTEDGIPARFERREGSWQVVSPVEAPADASALDAMAHALTSLPREGAVANPDGLEQYGLGEGARTVRFELAGEDAKAGKEMGVRIGGSTPVGGHTYVARLSDDDIAYVETYRINAFKRRLDDLRERRLFHFDAGDVWTLRVSWPEGDETAEVALARDERGEWQMGAPLSTRADQRTVRDLLSDLSFLRAKGFVDERTDAVEAALAHPLVTIYWTLEGDHLERRARIAGPFEDGLLVEGPDDRLYRIDAERRDDWKTRINDYRDKMLSEFDVSSARELVLEFAVDDGRPAERVEAGLAESGWTSEGVDLDSSRVSDLVRTLASLRAEDIVADEMGPDELASLGLVPPRVEIRIGGGAPAEEASRTLAHVEIGNPVEGRGVFARRAGEETVYLLPFSLAEEIPISREAFTADFEAREEIGDSAGESDPNEGMDEETLEGLAPDPLEGVEIP